MGTVRLGDAQLPWSWRPSPGGWFDLLAQRAQAWQPHPSLRLDRESIITRVLAAARGCETWLWHPALRRLLQDVETAMADDLQLAVWVAANSDGNLGRIAVPSPTVVWTIGGAKQIPAGLHHLGEIAADSASEWFCHSEPVLDLWCESVGAPQEGSWADCPPQQSVEVERLEQEVARYLRAVMFLKRQFQNCHSWISGITQICIPLRGSGKDFRSGSRPTLPAVVELDLLSEKQILEAMVHESAHLYLYLAEAAAPLVDPEHVLLYDSPLRPEPRPLRGILMAYHALAYICAFYRETAQVSLVADWAAIELPDLQAQARQAEQTLAGALRHFTVTGKEFFANTQQVLEYSVN